MYLCFLNQSQHVLAGGAEVLLQETVSGYDEAGRAEAALDPAVRDPRLLAADAVLRRAIPSIVVISLNSAARFSFSAYRPGRTVAVQYYRAGAAYAGTAADLSCRVVPSCADDGKVVPFQVADDGTGRTPFKVRFSLVII
jgi:hypothetical protein